MRPQKITLTVSLNDAEFVGDWLQKTSAAYKGTSDLSRSNGGRLNAFATQLLTISRKQYYNNNLKGEKNAER